jgi:hypothetical protein
MPIFGMLYFSKLFFNLRLDLTLMFIWLTGIMTKISDCIHVVTDSQAVVPAAEVS